MEGIVLDQLYPTFTIWGSEEKMSAEILKVVFKKITPGQHLKLKVEDENGFEIYAKPLLPQFPDPDAVSFSPFPETPVNKRIIFNAFIIVGIETSTPEPFKVEIQFV